MCVRNAPLEGPRLRQGPEGIKTNRHHDPSAGGAVIPKRV